MAITQIEKNFILGQVAGMFNAAPGANNLRDLSEAIESGYATFEELADILEATPEFQQGVLKGNVTFANQVSVLMENFGLTLGNTDPASADAQAEAFFGVRLLQGASFGDIVIEAGLYLLGNPAEEFADVAALFENKILVAGIYSIENSALTVSALQNVLKGVTAEGPATEEEAIAFLVAGGHITDPNAGETFTLTLNEDNLMGTSANDTFNASIVENQSTLQDFDTLNGGLGTDTLGVTVNSGIVTPTLTDIENVNLRSVSPESGINLSNSTGVAKVTVANSTANAVIAGAGAVGTLAVSNQSHNVKFSGSTATELTVEATNVAANTSTTIDLDNAVATTLTLNLNGAGTGLTKNVLNIDQAAATATTVNVNVSGDNFVSAATALNAAKTLAVAGASSLTVSETTKFEALETLNVSGGASVDLSAVGNLGNLKTVAAGEATGDISIIVDDTAVAVATGAGNDTIEYTAGIAAGATVSLGGGDDELTVTGADKTATVNAGEGTDTLAGTTANIAAFTADPDNAAVFDGFEVLKVTDVMLDTTSIDVSKIAGVGSFVAAAGVAAGGTADVTGLAADASVEIAGDGTATADQTETATVTFADIGAGETIILAGVTYTQGVDGDGTAADIAAFFDDDDFADWTSGVASGNDVTFTSKTANSNVADLANTGNGTVTNIAITQGAALASAGLLAIAMATDTAADVINLKLNNNYTENNDATSIITPFTHNVDASKVETLNVESTGTASEEFEGNAGTEADGVNNTLSLTNDDLVTLNVTGDQAFTFTSAEAMTKLATIDASALTAGATIDADAALNTSAALTITGSATASNTLTGSDGKDTIVGGAEADVITGGLGGDTLTGGDGNDSFIFDVVGSSNIGTGTFDTITDFSANTFGNGDDDGAAGTGAGAVDDRTGDVLQFAQFGDGSGGFKVDVLNSAADATTFLATNMTGNAVVAALDASNSNLYVDNTGDGVADFFIHLNGVTTIDAAAFQLIVV